MLQDIIEEIDEDGNGEVSFEEFANLAARFLIEEEEDTDAIQMELKGAFRMYDREGKRNLFQTILQNFEVPENSSVYFLAFNWIKLITCLYRVVFSFWSVNSKKF